MKRPIHESECDWKVWYEGTDREVRGKGLGDVGGDSKIGFGILELSPGANTRPSHHHSLEEEHLFVLNGEATLHLGSAKFDLTSGCYVCFPAGQELLHHLSNHSSEPFRYVMVGERIADDQITYETDA